MSINLNNTTPAAPVGFTNVIWQKDGSGNVSAYVPASFTVDLTAQGANIAATDLVAAGSVISGLYEISAYIQVTRVATTSSTLPQVTITFTDPDASQAQSLPITPAGITTNLLTAFAESVSVVNAKTAVAIQYATTGFASSGGTSMQYALHIKARAL